MNGKKGLEQGVIIGIIIALIGAAIIFLFFRTLSPKEIVDKETCKLSVLLRNTPSADQPVTGESAFKKIFPLKCKTQDILIDSKESEDAEKRVANAMYDCWDMLGEGKLDPFLEGWLKEFGIVPAKSACVICSTIKFSNRAQQNYKEIDIVDYLDMTYIPLKNLTYVEYFSNGAGTRLPTGYKTVPLETDKKYAVIFFGFEGEQIQDLLWKDVKGAIGAGGAGGIILGPGLIVGGLAAVATSIEAVLALIVGVVAQWDVSAFTSIFASIYCNGEQKGCYQIVLTEYSPEGLAKGNFKCDSIESIP